jgi:hypothetical protein
MKVPAFKKNLSLVLCYYCVAIIIVVVLTVWPAFVDGMVMVLFLSAPLLIPVLISFLLHTKMAHWFNAWPALLYVALIVLMRFAIEGAIVIAYFLFQIAPFVTFAIIGSWAAAWAYRKPRDLSLE